MFVNDTQFPIYFRPAQVWDRMTGRRGLKILMAVAEPEAKYRVVEDIRVARSKIGFDARWEMTGGHSQHCMFK